MGTSVDVDALAEEYSELAFELGSTKLVVDALGKPLRRKLAVAGVLPGDGMVGVDLPSFSFERTIFLGLNSFIFEVLLFGSLSGGRLGEKLPRWGGSPGEGSGLLPFGNATFAAVVAASLLPPTVPLLYASPAVDGNGGLRVSLGRLPPAGPEVLMGASPGYERLRS